jgi:alpha-amylase
MKRLLFLSILPLFLLFYALPVGAAEKEGRKWQDETVYFLMVDRFNNGDSKNDFQVNGNDPKAYHGGDFQGIIDRLDYLKDMGFTAICLNPIFDNEQNGYHGYWITDFYKPDEHFGSLKTFKKLVREAHKRDIKVMVDFVANQIGQTHPWVKEPGKQDWFHDRKDLGNRNNQKEPESTWINGLPDLAQENDEVKTYLIEAGKWWIEETDIDGYLLDSVNYVPVDFWKDFSKEVKGVKDDFYLLGEVLSIEPTDISKYGKAGFDGFVDYPLNADLRTAFKEPDHSLSQLNTIWESNKDIYENPYLMGTFMDSYHTVRFTRDVISGNEHPGPRWKLALTYLYTTPGIPMVYYGSEIALDGGEDPDNRRQMDFKTDKELIDYITKIGELRQELPSLTRGSLEWLYDKKGMTVYKREYQGETTIIAINNTSKTQSVTLSGELEENKELRGLLNGDLVRSKGNEYNIVLDRDKGEIYVLADRTGLNYVYILTMTAIIVGFLLFFLYLTKRGKKDNPPA